MASGKRKGGDQRPAKTGHADPEQYERFLHAAREAGCEENMDRLDDALRRLGKAPPEPRQHRERPKKEGGSPD